LTDQTPTAGDGMEHPGPADAATLRADFDRLAVLEDGRWDHNRHYHGWLLRRLPAECRSALDVGCGTGDFTRLLSRRCGTVTGVDLSPRMIDLARARAVARPVQGRRLCGELLPGAQIRRRLLWRYSLVWRRPS
jgi:SAM-dependent methyltransferase